MAGSSVSDGAPGTFPPEPEPLPAEPPEPVEGDGDDGNGFVVAGPEGTGCAGVGSGRFGPSGISVRFSSGLPHDLTPVHLPDLHCAITSPSLPSSHVTARIKHS